MFYLKLICICTVIYTTASNSHSHNNITKRFPDDFLFGVSTAAYQIEGGWNIDGKGPSIWDEFTHSHPEMKKDHQNGDEAANSYEYFMDDINAIKEMGMNFYRFSIAWSRVLPNGDITNINEKGIQYYNKLIDKMLELNIEPMITIYHFDLPQKLELSGGFTNSSIVDYFKSYANLLFERFGNRVKYWITFNEPNAFCNFGYGGDSHAPALNFSGVANYLCGHNVLKAHAVVYHLYQNSYRDQFKAKIGIALNMYFYYSETNNSMAIERAMQFWSGWFATPIFGDNGNYPPIMIEQISMNSIQEGRNSSRLPTFSKQWIELIRGSADFLGVNYYTSRFVVERLKPKGLSPSFDRDRNLNFNVKKEWKQASSDWLYSVPYGLGDLLRWIQKQYNNPDMFILENGWSDQGELEDNDRVKYMHDHLHQIQEIVLNNECNLKGYAAWSAIDNFEWENGYTEKFGFYYVNMSSPRKERIPKKSAKYMRTVTKSRRISKIYEYE